MGKARTTTWKSSLFFRTKTYFCVLKNDQDFVRDQRIESSGNVFLLQYEQVIIFFEHFFPKLIQIYFNRSFLQSRQKMQFFLINFHFFVAVRINSKKKYDKFDIRYTTHIHTRQKTGQGFVYIQMIFWEVGGEHFLRF